MSTQASCCSSRESSTDTDNKTLPLLTPTDKKRRKRKTKKTSVKQTTWVRAEKHKGEIVTPFDYYIGPRVNNEHWQLPESKWCNPFFHITQKNLSKGLAMYERHVLHNKELREALPQIAGSVLADFSPSVDLCHASVLIKLANRCLPQIDTLITNALTIYFKGNTTPLSNYFPCKLVIEGEEYSSAVQAYSHRHLQYMHQRVAAKQVLESKNPFEAYKIHKNILSLCKTGSYNFERQIQEMAFVLQQKWEQCPEFSKYLLLRGEKYEFVEATRNCFWGAGQDLNQITCSTPADSLPGRNLLGWIIKYVYCQNNHPALWKKMVSNAQKSPLLKEITYYSGLLSVANALKQKNKK